MLINIENDEIFPAKLHKPADVEWNVTPMLGLLKCGTAKTSYLSTVAIVKAMRQTTKFRHRP